VKVRVGRPMTIRDLERISERVVIDDRDCWLWMGLRTKAGYGQMRMGKTFAVHRILYEAVVAPIPEGLVTDHLCRVRGCVNPRHLEPVTRRENSARGNCGAHLRAKTHCPQGHPYSGENLYVEPAGGRSCRQCKRDKRKARPGAESWSQRNRAKSSAYNAVYRAIRAGRLIRQPCELCGDSGAEAHHEDYARPLDVTWLCHVCHSKLHADRKRAAA
jgi:hypothetical protein